MKIGGYIVKRDGKFRIADFDGKILGKCVRTGVTKRPIGSRGAWISSTTESFRCEVDGKQYVGRNGGESLFINMRAAKRPVRTHFAGLRRRSRR